ncbi:hypothetical protein SAMN05443637_12248 [Pseudonocardia thermophila]|uniref:Uncharacterized protein n=1 Tax=Pseudonocardia thermophila TaxID=1848 RepID=A0A1M6Z2V3_PSETH|nr:hypothetical protein [Pseudonocardia thermophila]SHL24705.1 hypothetical protein SAMN05443637_12248 [Pseudonocardia thermophila]
MARHRHAVNVRTDGLAAVLGPLAGDPAVRAALLVDIDSGMVLGATGQPLTECEEVGALHGELMRLACSPVVGMVTTPPETGGDPAIDAELTVNRGPRRHLVVRRIADPHGDRLALSILVDGPPRVLRRVRRRLGAVSAAALTAGPTVSLRPRDGAWVPGVVEERPVLRAPSRTFPAAPRAGTARGPQLPALSQLDEGLAGPGPHQGATARPPVAPSSPPPGEPALPAQAQRRPAPPSALPPRPSV